MDNYTMTLMDNTQITAVRFESGYIDKYVQWLDRSERTTQTYLTNLKQFLAWIRYKAITQPTRQDIIDFRDWLSVSHDAIEATPDGWKFRTDANGNRIQVSCKPYTIKQYLQSVRQFFKWLADFGYYPNIASNIHTPKIKKDIHKKDALSSEEVLTVEKSILLQTESKTAEAGSN